jgi:molybdenum cofactor cytidylyltransferase
VVTRSHDPKLDDPALIAALRSPAFYIGALGSRRTHAGRVARLTGAGIGDRDVARIHAPVGLDLGGRGAADIAIAILAEITRSRHHGAATARIAALVLAAGHATRMGGANKLLCEVDGKPLVRRVADAACASRCRPVMVVTGFAEEAIVAALGGAPVSLAHNADHACGLSTSLRRGLAALPVDVDGALILLADMPWIGAADIDRLIAAFDPADPRIVVPVRGGRRGNPVLWPRRHFAAIRALSGDSGARELLAQHAAEVSAVDFDDDAIFADVDTPADLLRRR